MPGFPFFLLGAHVTAKVRLSPGRNAFPESGVRDGCRGRVFRPRRTKGLESCDMSRSKHEVYS